jgi:hypothetical protein
VHSSIEERGLEELKSAWATLFRVPAPADEQFALWEFQHDLAIMKTAIGQLATKYQKLGGAMGQDFMIRFASSVMKRLSSETGEGQRNG